MGGGENTDAYKRTFAGSQWFPPISIFGTTTLTHTNAGQTDLIDDGFKANDNVAFQGLIAYAGAITSNIGAFVEGVGNSTEHKSSWEMADVRYANTGSMFGGNLIYGVTVHNNPTLQDVWNNTPAWGYPFTMSDLAPHPDASTMLEGQFSFQVVGAGAYAWINDLVYAEITGYRTLSKDTLTRLGVNTEGTSAINNGAPYWRLAVEPTWGFNSLEIGTFGMSANIIPQRMEGFGTDRKTDVGFDAQYQYIVDAFSITVRATFITEWLNNSASQALGFATNNTDRLNSFRASGTFVWGQNQRISFTGAYFNTYGSTDPLLYPNSATGSPDSSGWIAEIAYMPYGMNRPQIWPWFNAKIGLQYTWYTKFNGASTNFDGNGRNASDNNTLLLYLTLLM